MALYKSSASRGRTCPSARSARIAITEIGSDDDDDDSNSSGSPALKPEWKWSLAAGWVLNSSTVDRSAVTLVLAPPATGFNVAELDLEVVAGGVVASAGEDESKKKCFSLGDTTGRQASSFTLEQWAALIGSERPAADADAAADARKAYAFDPDAAKAKYKKASKELTITLPLV